MSAVQIEDAGWKAIMADERLANARRKLSFHEIRLIVDHARAKYGCPFCGGHSTFKGDPAESFCDDHYRQYLLTFQISPKDLNAYRAKALSLVERLTDEADLCRNEGADDIANLLDEAGDAIGAKARAAQADKQ